MRREKEKQGKPGCVLAVYTSVLIGKALNHRLNQCCMSEWKDSLEAGGQGWRG